MLADQVELLDCVTDDCLGGNVDPTELDRAMADESTVGVVEGFMYNAGRFAWLGWISDWQRRAANDSKAVA